jgi:hypothetical protein
VQTVNATLNRKERRAQQLLAHYERCEALAKRLGVANPDGKRISVALVKAERLGAWRALALCNDSSYTARPDGYDRSERDVQRITELVREALGAIPPGFFVNGDPRGYALKIDNEDSAGKALIDELRLHTDWGGYGILSPEITGD